MNENHSVPVVRLHADEDGESHFTDDSMTLGLAEFAPPAPAILVSPPTAAARSMFLALPDNWSSEAHPAPREQLMVMMSGAIEVTVSDGETRTFTTGDVIMIEDTTGKGHTTRSAAPNALAIVVQT
ncbi:hypothetical protein ABZU32_30840 [Sphaerisporangium sp. NPDC005288]|uniref:hypothetical protein n=1 Tax=Sphaerisporangium sp. NPDC005288 TaxID=3155114 RepID=UPI0033AFE628